MSEQTFWKGTSSHWKNIKSYALFFASIPAAFGLSQLLAENGPWAYLLVAVTGFIAFCNWLVIVTTQYEITDERLITSRGILTKVTDTLELYRVRDLQTVQPLFQRLVGLQNVHVVTADATHAEVVLDYMPEKLKLGDELRRSVEACRRAKGVRSLDMTNEVPGDHVEGHPTE